MGKPNLAEALRALLKVIEAGHVNSEQKRLIPYVHVALGDLERVECPHLNTVYEEGDALICQDCRHHLNQ